MIYLALLLKMLVAHCLADYPLQGDFLAAAKNHRKPVPGVPWALALGAHSCIQAGAVWFVTDSLFCGVLEFFLHWGIDYQKSEQRITFAQDQALHIGCKFFYLFMYAALL